jgi:hypothetical protein
MIEILLAAFVPVAVLLIAARFGDQDFRRASLWFAVLALFWLAPCWLRGRSPAAFDYLAEDVPPWQQPGFHSANPLLSDPPLQFLPWREVVRDSILRGSMPFLDRYEASGSPLWENPQSGATFPLTWIGLPFSTFGWPLFAAMTKLLVAMAGMYLFLRARGSSHGPAMLGAIAYAFCAFNIVFLLFPHTNVTTLLPFLLLAIERMNAPLLAIVLALLMVGGHPESVLHCAVVAVPYAILVMLRTRRVMPIVAGGVCGLLLSAPAIVPFALYLPMTERAARIAREPDLVRAPPLTLANLDAFVTVAHLGETRNPDAPVNFNEVASQYAGALTFVLAAVAMILDARRQRFWTAIFLVAAFFSFDSPPARAITQRLPLANVTMHGRLRFVAAFAVCVLAAAAIDRFVRMPAMRVGAIGIIYADLAAMLLTYNPAVSRDFFYPPVLRLDGGRVAALENALRPNTATMLRGEDIGFHNPMTFEPYASLLARAGYDRSTYLNVFPRVPPRPLLDFLGVRQAVAPPGVVLPNPMARERVMPLTIGATAAITKYEPNRETIAVRSRAPARIATSEVALPGWRLFRNGVSQPIVKLRGVFIGFEAPAGTSEFELIYRPAGFDAAIILFVLGIALFAVLVRWK